MASRRQSGRYGESGVTLLELMIAVTLVAGLSTGMLMAMRTSLLTYQKTANRLESNRRFVKAQQILYTQIAAVIPVQGLCPPGSGMNVTVPSFLNGSTDSLLLVSSYSMAEGARGYPRIVEYRVMPGERGSVRLMATELPYSGPQSTIAFCAGAAPIGPDANSYVLADHLAYCRFSYHEPYDQNTFLETPWVPLWTKPLLPAGVRIDMRPAMTDTGGLTALSLTIPISVNRDPMLVYDDRF